MYKKITKNDPEGKLYRIYLQLWDTAGQERYLTVFFIFYYVTWSCATVLYIKIMIVCYLMM